MGDGGRARDGRLKTAGLSQLEAAGLEMACMLDGRLEAVQVRQCRVGEGGGAQGSRLKAARAHGVGLKMVGKSQLQAVGSRQHVQDGTGWERV